MTIQQTSPAPVHDERLVPLGPVADLARHRRAVVTVDGVELLVLCVRRRFTVVENSCPHLGSPLADARVSGRTLVCASHGYKYSLGDGAHIPGWRCPSREAGRLRLFPTRVEGEILYAEVGAPHEVAG